MRYVKIYQIILFLLFCFSPLALSAETIFNIETTSPSDKTYCLAELPKDTNTNRELQITNERPQTTDHRQQDTRPQKHNNSPAYLALSPEGITTFSPPSVIASSPPSVIARSETTKQSLTLSKFRLTPHAGVYIPLGEDLQISYLAGLDFVWNINQIVNLRLGAEYSNPGIENGNDLQIFKIPFMLVENENTPNLWGFKKLFYTGIGLVYINGKFNNVEKQGLGGAFLIGRKFGSRFTAEVKFDALRKNEGYQFGGISTYLNYSF